MAPADYDEQQRTAIAARTLLERWGSAEHVVSTVCYLVEADYITGETIYVDGSEHLAQYKQRG